MNAELVGGPGDGRQFLVYPECLPEYVYFYYSFKCRTMTISAYHWSHLNNGILYYKFQGYVE